MNGQLNGLYRIQMRPKSKQQDETAPFKLSYMSSQNESKQQSHTTNRMITPNRSSVRRSIATSDDRFTETERMLQKFMGSVGESDHVSQAFSMSEAMGEDEGLITNINMNIRRNFKRLLFERIHNSTEDLRSGCNEVKEMVRQERAKVQDQCKMIVRQVGKKIRDWHENISKQTVPLKELRQNRQRMNLMEVALREKAEQNSSLQQQLKMTVGETNKQRVEILELKNQIEQLKKHHKAKSEQMDVRCQCLKGEVEKLVEENESLQEYLFDMEQRMVGVDLQVEKRVKSEVSQLSSDRRGSQGSTTNRQYLQIMQRLNEENEKLKQKVKEQPESNISNNMDFEQKMRIIEAKEQQFQRKQQQIQSILSSFNRKETEILKKQAQLKNLASSLMVKQRQAIQIERRLQQAQQRNMQRQQQVSRAYEQNLHREQALSHAETNLKQRLQEINQKEEELKQLQMHVKSHSLLHSPSAELPSARDKYKTLQADQIVMGQQFSLQSFGKRNSPRIMDEDPNPVSNTMRIHSPTPLRKALDPRIFKKEQDLFVRAEDRIHRSPPNQENIPQTKMSNFAALNMMRTGMNPQRTNTRNPSPNQSTSYHNSSSMSHMLHKPYRQMSKNNSVTYTSTLKSYKPTSSNATRRAVGPNTRENTQLFGLGSKLNRLREEIKKEIESIQ